MIEIPFTQTLKQPTLSTGSCNAPSSLQPSDSQTDDYENSTIFADLIGMLLSADPNRQLIKGDIQATSLLAAEGLAALNIGNDLPLASLNTGKTLPQRLSINSILNSLSEGETTLELSELTMPVGEVVAKTRDSVEFIQSLLSRGGFQQEFSQANFKADHLSSNLLNTIEAPGIQTNSASYLESLSNMIPVKDAPLLLDTQKLGWEKILGERVILVASQGIQTARMQLNPPELGPLKIDLAMDGDQVNVSFVTVNTQAKEAIDLSMPKLREMFQGAGLELADAQVFDQKSQQGFQGQTFAAIEPIIEQADLGEPDQQNVPDQSIVSSNHLALLDAYA